MTRRLGITLHGRQDSRMPCVVCTQQDARRERGRPAVCMSFVPAPVHGAESATLSAHLLHRLFAPARVEPRPFTVGRRMCHPIRGRVW